MWRKMIIILLISNDWTIYKENNMACSLQPYQLVQEETYYKKLLRITEGDS